MSPIPCQTNLRITNHRGHKFPPSVTLVSFKTRIKWRPVLKATACFPSVFFQLQQYSRKHSSFSAHKAALRKKTELIFPAFSLTLVDFAVQFCFRGYRYSFFCLQVNKYQSIPILSAVNTYGDIFESTTFCFQIGSPSTCIRRSRQGIRKLFNLLSRVERNKWQ